MTTAQRGYLRFLAAAPFLIVADVFAAIGHVINGSFGRYC